MVVRQETDDDSDGGSGSGRLLMVIVLVLAVAATTVLVLADNTRWLRLGVLAALWAALFGVLLAVRFRKLVADRENEVSDLQSVYELELEREVAARREYELEVEAEARKRIEEGGRADLADLRAELHALRESLERLTGGEVLVERFALQARSTRMRALADNQPKVVTADPAQRGIAAGQPVRRPVEPATELIARQSRSATNITPVVRPGTSQVSRSGMPPVSHPGLPPASRPGMAPVSYSGLPPASRPAMAPVSRPGMAPVSRPGTSPMSRATRSVPGMPPVVRLAESRPAMSPVRPNQSMPDMSPVSQPGMAPVTRPQSAPPPGVRREAPRRENQRPGGYRPEPSRPQTPREGAIPLEDTGSRRELPPVGLGGPPPNQRPPIREQQRPLNPQARPPQQLPQQQRPQQFPPQQQPLLPQQQLPQQQLPQQQLPQQQLPQQQTPRQQPRQQQPQQLPQQSTGPQRQQPQPPMRPMSSVRRDAPPLPDPDPLSDWPPQPTGPDVSRPNAPHVEPPHSAQHAAAAPGERTHRSEPVTSEPTRHRVTDPGQPHQDWQSYREWRAADDEQPHHTGPQSGLWNTDPEATGAHTAGRSVTELLAAHGNQEPPSRHRRRAD